MARRALAASLAAISFLVLAAPARADERYFAWGYNAMTPSQGEREIELYVHAKDFAKGTLEHQVSFDYGITDHWSVEPYLKFSQTGLESFAAKSAKLQTRYRFLDDGVWNPALAAYAEVEQPFKSELPKLEGKLLVSKDLGPAQLATNLVVERSLAGVDTELGYTLGASLPLADWLVVAAEAKGSKVNLPGATHIAGPSAFYRGRGFKVGAGWGFDLSGQGKHQARAVGAVEF